MGAFEGTLFATSSAGAAIARPRITDREAAYESFMMNSIWQVLQIDMSAFEVDTCPRNVMIYSVRLDGPGILRRVLLYDIFSIEVVRASPSSTARSAMQRETRMTGLYTTTIAKKANCIVTSS